MESKPTHWCQMHPDCVSATPAIPHDCPALTRKTVGSVRTGYSRPFEEECDRLRAENKRLREAISAAIDDIFDANMPVYAAGRLRGALEGKEA